MRKWVIQAYLRFTAFILLGENSLGSPLPQSPICGWVFSRNFNCPDYSDSPMSPWQRQVQCWLCQIGTEYHCARVIGDNEEFFKEGCAVPKNCTIGTEPRMDIDKGTITCENCHDRDKFNDDNLKLSSTFSDCRLDKTICTEKYHLISCGRPDLSSENRWCRCDARNNYVFYGGHPDEHGCSNSLNTKCVKFNDCGDGKDRSVRGDYMICLEDCPAGEYRPHNSDDCLKTKEIPVMETSLSTTHMAVNATLQPDSTTQKKDDTTPGTERSTVSTGMLIGLIFGGIGFAGLITLGIVMYVMCYQRRCAKESPTIQEPNVVYTVVPQEDADGHQAVNIGGQQNHDDNQAEPVVEDRPVPQENIDGHQAENIEGQQNRDDNQGVHTTAVQQIPGIGQAGQSGSSTEQVTETAILAKEPTPAITESVKDEDDDSKQHDYPKRLNHSAIELKDIYKDVLKRLYTYIVEDMDPKSVRDRLNGENIFLDVSIRDIKDKPDQSEENRAILDLFKRGGSEKYIVFKKILDSSKQEVIVDKLEKAEEEELKKLCKYQEGEKDAIPKDNKYKKGDRYQSKDETSQDTNAADSDSKACSDNTTVSTDEHSDQRRSVHSEGIIDADLHSPQTKHS